MDAVRAAHPWRTRHHTQRTRNDAGEIQIRGSSLEAFAGSFQQAEAAMESPDGLGPMMPEYNGKPSEGLARLR